MGHGPDQMLECAKYIIGIFSDLRARLPCSAWTDMEIPSTNMNEAMMRADYHHLQFTVLLPYLFFACHRAQFPESGAWSAKQTELAKVAITCVNSGFLSIIAFDRVGADPKRAYSTAREVYDVVPTHLNPVKHSNKYALRSFPGQANSVCSLLRTALVFTAFRKSQLFLQIGGQTLFSVVPLDNLMQKIAKEIQLVARISPLAKLYIDILYNVMHQG